MQKTTFILTLFTFPVLFGLINSNTENCKFGSEIEAQLEADSTPWKYQTGAVEYSFIGDYKNALSTWDRAMPPRIYVATSLDSSLLKNSRIQDAHDYIIERAKKEQVVIINEAHHNAKHRTFTHNLLEGLYKNGYRYLGLEALADTNINSRNFVITESGYYTQEPEFGNLVYEARKLGFTVFGYEAGQDKNGKEREIEQARNIQAFMQNNTQGKYIIHCGYDHVFEKEVQSWEKAMAGRLKEYTEIDPLTIDQVKFTERSKAEYSHYFVSATQQRNPFVLIKQTGEVFNGIREPQQTDIVVIHPITTYSSGRPSWLAEGKVGYRVSQKKLSAATYPLQVIAYRAGEYNQQGIPADIIELKDNASTTPLFLKKGKYTLVIKNSKHELIDTYTTTVR